MARGSLAAQGPGTPAAQAKAAGLADCGRGAWRRALAHARVRRRPPGRRRRCRAEPPAMFRPARETALPAAGLCARSRGIAEGRPCSFLKDGPAAFCGAVPRGRGQAMRTRRASAASENLLRNAASRGSLPLACRRAPAGRIARRKPEARQSRPPAGRPQLSKRAAEEKRAPSACRGARVQEGKGRDARSASAVRWRPAKSGCAASGASFPHRGRGPAPLACRRLPRRELTGRASTAGQGPGFPRARRGAHGCRLRQSGRRP